MGSSFESMMGVVDPSGISREDMARFESSTSQALKEALARDFPEISPAHINLAANRWSGILAIPCIPLAIMLIMQMAGNAPFQIPVISQLPSSIMLSLIIPLLILPVMVNAWVMAYPKKSGAGDRKAMLQGLGDLVTYMIISMRLNPSLPEALRFAHSNLRGPVRNRVQELLWGAYSRKHSGIETAFGELADEVKGMDGGSHRILMLLRSVELEGNPVLRSERLTKAALLARENAITRIEEYSSGLQTPVYGLFGLIILPIFILSVIPLFTFSGMYIPMELLGMVFVLLLPGAIQLFSSRVLKGSPVSSSGQAKFPSIIMVMSAVVVSIVIAATLTWVMPGNELIPLAIIWSVTITWMVTFLLPTLGSMATMRRRDQLEKEFPDLLYHLGVRMQEGASFEKALRDVVDTYPRWAISTLFSDALMRTSSSLTPLSSVMDELDRSGDASSLIKATMAMLLSSLSKDQAGVGTVLSDLASFLHDIAGIEQESRNRLRPTADMMKGTVLFFAPLILGISASLMGLINAADYADMAGTSVPTLSLPIFIAVVAAYIVLTSVIITRFSSSLGGSNPVTRVKETSVAPVISLVVYTVGFLLGTTMVG